MLVDHRRPADRAQCSRWRQRGAACLQLEGNLKRDMTARVAPLGVKTCEEAADKAFEFGGGDEFAQIRQSRDALNTADVSLAEPRDRDAASQRPADAAQASRRRVVRVEAARQLTTITPSCCRRFAALPARSRRRKRTITQKSAIRSGRRSHLSPDCG